MEYEVQSPATMVSPLISLQGYVDLRITNLVLLKLFLVYFCPVASQK